MELEDLYLCDIQPSQFYISEEKLAVVREWFRADDLSDFQPIPIRKLGNTIIFTDGHTRAWAAYCAGLKRVPLVWDEDDMDWEAYGRCVAACRE